MQKGEVITIPECKLDGIASFLHNYDCRRPLEKGFKKRKGEKGENTGLLPVTWQIPSL